MFRALISMWVLFVGLALLWFGSGMSYALLVLRADVEGFSTFEIGIMQTAYQIGWVVAALIAAHLIRRVGHIRVFGAMAAGSSAIIILFLLYINPWLWAFERFVMGICTAILMVVCESWLNDMAENKIRGKVFAMYTILAWGTPAMGIWSLRYQSIDSAFFFILASVCISIAVIPMLLSVSHSPGFIDSDRIGLKKMLAISPLGVIGALLSGACHGAFFAMVVIFGTVSDLSVKEISTLTTIGLLSGILTQWPISVISDRVDRRIVLASIAIAGGMVGIYFALQTANDINDLYIAVGCLGALVLSLYSLCVSHANDYLTPQQIVPASSTLILVYGTGYAFAPVIVSPLLSVSPNFFFLCTGVLMLTMGFYVIYRMMRREAVEVQGDTLSISTASPYTSVVTAAEQWGEDVETVQGQYDQASSTHAEK